MRFRKLNKRLSAIAELVREGATVCDVGTDHAYLPCFLARSGKYRRIYAGELNPGPLAIAKAEIERQGLTPEQSPQTANSVILVQSDGLLSIPPPEENDEMDVIIAGMGGELIAEIAEKCPFKNPDLRLILQPMTRQDDLRRRLPLAGYEIILEKTVCDRKRTCTIIYAKCIYNKENNHDYC
jgi:tRNA (adenine22-N1)-methyltransferase